MNKTSQEYDQIIAKCRDIFAKKTKDYGTAWRILRASSLTDQIFIKARRIRSIQEKGTQMIDESTDGEFIAMVNYSIMAIIQLRYPPVEGDDRYQLEEEKALEYFETVISETKALMEAKNHDYGEVWREMRVSSITDLILMKILRVKQIEDNQGKTLISEGLEANFQDMLNYSVFALILQTL